MYTIHKLNYEFKFVPTLTFLRFHTSRTNDVFQDPFMPCVALEGHTPSVGARPQ